MLHIRIHVYMLQAKICVGKADRRTPVPHSTLRMLPYTITLSHVAHTYTYTYAAGENLLRKSGQAYTIVRPGRLIDGVSGCVCGWCGCGCGRGFWCGCGCGLRLSVVCVCVCVSVSSVYEA